MPDPPGRERGFTLVELLVVVIVIGIIAAIAIPRYLSTQVEARNSMAVSDLRSLIVIELGLEASTGLSESAAELAAEGWSGSSDRIRVCAETLDEGRDMTLTAWHLDGSTVYTYTRSIGSLQANEIDIEETCAAQVGTTVRPVWPLP